MHNAHCTVCTTYLYTCTSVQVYMYTNYTWRPKNKTYLLKKATCSAFIGFNNCLALYCRSSAAAVGVDAGGGAGVVADCRFGVPAADGSSRAPARRTRPPTRR